MDTIKTLRLTASRQKKTIILPEADDARVVQAHRIILNEGIANSIILSRKDLDKKNIEKFSDEYFSLRKPKGMSIDDVKQMMSDPLYYAAMMTKDGRADGFVAGASHTTPSVARAAIWCLGVDERIMTVSSCFIMVLSNDSFGEKGVLFFADCGIVPEPNPRQLAQIAISTSELAKKVLGIPPRMAMLSYSTKGSASGAMPEKVRQATEMVKELMPDLLIEGEIQADAALIPEVAKIKDPQTKLAGGANVLIFPNLEAGNIAYKLVQRLAGARAIGPLLQGLNFPCSDLSRGCAIEDIVDCVAVTAIRAQKNTIKN